MKETRTITAEITGLAEPILETMGFELVDMEYLCERGHWVLRLYIDKEKGVTLDDCARVSRELGDVMDARDLIAHSYVLEVSSPGWNRPLRKEQHFLRVVGKKIKARTYAPVVGRRNFTGTLIDFRDDTLFMDSNGEKVALRRADIEKANLVHEYEA
ncbi:MAG: ribosome maturation factor RimP [Deltaproteobacteria bacterium]|nr:ribosome maturation factor RimP [Deltaproteobacteria bacterium]